MTGRVRHDGPGYRMVIDGDYEVLVYREDRLCRCHGQWIARAEWSRYYASDPQMTMREAIAIARGMIAIELADGGAS